MINIYSILFLPAMLLLRFLLSLTIGGFPAKGVSWTEAVTKWHHPTQKLDDIRMQNLVNVLNGHYDHFNNTLDKILVPRVPGTPGHDDVRQYIIKAMKLQGWSVEEDSFTANTPHGKKPFSNIIATLNPEACRRLVISCHYDSLYNREYTFMGATDSAVPCTMMIHLAKILNRQLHEQKSKNNDLTLQFVFFDGEEAFHKWSHTDSLYGSRHLAALWNNKPFPNGDDGKHCQGRADYASYLDRMDVMVLLDLIGTSNPKFYSYFPDTNGLYLQLIEIEQRLNSLKLLETYPPEGTTHYFDARSNLAFVEDDHIPFMKKGVPIVHLIPSPFPHVWHKESDNKDNLHHPTIHNLNKVLLVFIAQYLHLNIPQDPLVM